jgi:hypothetical protein
VEDDGWSTDKLGNATKQKHGLALWRFFCDDGENERRTDDIIFVAAVSGYMGLLAGAAAGEAGTGEDIVRVCRISLAHPL